MIKEDLKDFASSVQTSNESHRLSLRAKLERESSSSSTVAKKRFAWMKFVVMPTSALAVLVLLVVTSVPRDTVDDLVYMPEPAGIAGSLSESADLESTASYMTVPSSKTFYERFLDGLGSNTASIEDSDAYRDEYGNLLEEDISFKMLAHDESVHQNIDELFTIVDGSIVSINDFSEDIREIQGSIPTDKKDFFIEELTEFVKNDNFITKISTAESRIADVVVIDEKILEVEEAIAALEEELTRDHTEEGRLSLEAQLQDLKNFLEERNDVKEEILNRVEMIDVVLRIEMVPKWGSATTLSELERSWYGFEDPSMFQQLFLNALFVLLKILLVLSYTFWLIVPLFIWHVWKRKERITLRMFE